MFDNAAAEAFFPSLEWEVLSRHTFEKTDQAQAVVLDRTPPSGEPVHS